MSVSVAIPNLDNALKDVRSYANRVSDEVVDVVNGSAIRIQAGAKRNVTRHGMKYDSRRKTTRRMLIDTGLMRSSINIGFQQNRSDLRTLATGNEPREEQ